MYFFKSFYVNLFKSIILIYFKSISVNLFECIYLKLLVYMCLFESIYM